MKQLIFAVALLLLVHSNSIAQSEDYNLKNPGDYNNYIMKEMTEAVRKNFEYISFTVHSEAYDLMEGKRGEVIDQIKTSKEKISQMPAFEGDTHLRDAALNALDEYENAFALDYKEIIGLKKKSKDSYEAMEAYFKAEDRAEDKVNKATIQLRKAQQSYASKNNMSIAESKSHDALEEKMQNVKEVNAYWRDIFITYFKVSKEYDRMWDVLEDQKAGPLENQRHAVEKITQQTLEELHKKSAYKGDREFLDQTIGIIEYYQKTAEVDFAQIVELLKKKVLTQEDVDTVNSIINKCNSDHERLAYNWNIASQDLLRKNVDKQ